MLSGKGSVAPPDPADRNSGSSLELWNRLSGPYRGYLDDVGDLLQQQIGTFEPEIAGHASYVISNPGKRIRPLLVGLAGGAHKGYGRNLVAIGVIIEMIHLATLIHDDILDSALLRRNRPTLSVNTGNRVTVLLGDCLFAHALTLAASIPTTAVCLAVARATKRVCSGEIRQSFRQGTEGSRADYLKTIEMKTAELFGLSCDLGARHGNTLPSCADALRQFGLALGTAYQIYDDCLDLFCSEASTHKSVGRDLAQGKRTLPIHLLLEVAARDESHALAERLLRWDPEQNGWLLDMLGRHDIPGRCSSFVRSLLDRARDRLRPAPSLRPLLDMADYLECKLEDIAPGLSLQTSGSE